ncbi:hypothetical protein Ahy_A05g023138 [Arachis hypogaea]|uniref:MULE transposase domain-containing protein n=1 Tax=Arachis hypogaea TaxID=3818 RepID=A0A445D2F8_ARAHY|nr:hypothetical protein Ahy_A05g023138 [Arachis hypogaea]
MQFVSFTRAKQKDAFSRLVNYRNDLWLLRDGDGNVTGGVFVESETTELWSFFLSNLRYHVTPQPGIMIISDRSQAIRAALNAPHSGWHLPSAYHAYYIWYMVSNFNFRFKSAEGKRYLINVGYNPSKEGCD